MIVWAFCCALSLLYMKRPTLPFVHHLSRTSCTELIVPGCVCRQQGGPAEERGGGGRGAEVRGMAGDWVQGGGEAWQVEG